MSEITQKDIARLHNVENEKSILVTLIEYGSAISEVIYELKGEYFFDDDNRHVFDAINGLYLDGKSVDFITVVTELMATNTKPLQPGQSWGEYVASICGEVGGGASIAVLKDHVNILIDMYNRRLLLSKFRAAERSICDFNDYETVIEPVSNAINSVQGFGSSLKAYADGADELIELIRKQEAGEDTGVRTDFRVFDSEGGLQPGSTVVVGAYSGVGKSAFAAALAFNIANHHDNAVGFISLEMPMREIVGRMAATELFHRSRLLGGPLLNLVQILRNRERRAPFETQAILDAIRETRNSKIIFEESSFTLSDIAASIRDMVLRKHVKVIVIDFLQKILADRASMHKRREEILSDATSLFKTLAKKYDICIVELSQLTPDNNNKQDRTPRYWELKGAQAIYENCDMLVLINRPEKEGDDRLTFEKPFQDVGIKGRAQLIVGKNRNGQDGVSYIVGFDASTTTFYEDGDCSADSEPF